MKLSEALRLGSTMVPQAFGKNYESVIEVALIGFPVVSEKILAACALGAAFLAVGERYGEEANGEFNDVTFSRLGWDVAILPSLACAKLDSLTCPEISCTAVFLPDTSLEGAIVHLNDDHRWTMTKIAEYVEWFENRCSPQPAVGPVEEKHEQVDPLPVL